MFRYSLSSADSGKRLSSIAYGSLAECWACRRNWRKRYALMLGSIQFRVCRSRQRPLPEGARRWQRLASRRGLPRCWFRSDPPDRTACTSQKIRSFGDALPSRPNPSIRKARVRCRKCVIIARKAGDHAIGFLGGIGARFGLAAAKTHFVFHRRGDKGFAFAHAGGF